MRHNIQGSRTITRRPKDGNDGNNGNDGITTQAVYIRNNVETDYPTMPSGNNLNGWTFGRQAPTLAYRFEWTTQRSGNDKVGWSAWSTPIIINRWVKDGEDGKDGASDEFGFRLSATNSAPVKPTGALPNASWTYTMPLMTTSNRYLWITKRTKAQGSSTWSVWDPPVLHAYFPKDGEPGVGIPGTPGLPGQIPIEKEWIEGDTHRNTDEYVDYIYVRGTTAELSYFYKLTAKGTKIAGAKPTGGSTPTGYEPISWMKELAVKVFIAEEANIAGLIHKQEKLFSQTGETYAGIPLAIGEYIEYNFANTTSQPTISSTSWTDLPSGTIRWVRYKKNTESFWTVKQVGTSANQWQLQFAIEPENETWYSSYSTNRFWMRYKTTDDDDYGKAVKITTAGGVDFIPNILIDGVTGRMEMLSAKIRGEIEAIMGRIGGLIIENSRLLSKNHKVEIDGENGLIMLKDDSLTLRTIIHPNNIVSIDEYFASEGSYNVDLSSLNTANFTGEKSKGLSIPGDRNKMHQLSIPSFTIGAYATLTSSAADSDKVEVATKAWLLQDGVPFIDLGSAVAIAYGDAPKSQTVTIPSRTIPVLGGRRYVIEITNGAQNQEDPYATTYGSISGLSSMFTGSLINRSEIGNNGMVMATSQLNYDYMVDGLHQVRRGAIGLRITSSGIQKSSNMSASNPTWTNL